MKKDTDITEQLDNVFGKVFPVTTEEEEAPEPYKHISSLTKRHPLTQQDPDTSLRTFYLLYGL